MAGFLVADVVSSSLLNSNDLRQVVGQLYKKCRRELRFLRSRVTKIKVVAVATGDGVFFCLDESIGRANPGLILLDLAFKLQDWGRHLPDKLGLPKGIHFRMGIHEGTHYHVKDPSGQANFSGQDVNEAQRIMACGEADHILCSAHARKVFFRQMPKSHRQVALHEIPYAYKVKHDEDVFIVNIIKSKKSRVINGNRKPPKVRLNPDMQLFPAAKSIKEFRGVRHLTVVGVTNDQIGQMLGIELAASKERKSPTIKRLDVYYAMDDVYKYLPKQEKSLHYPGAVKGRRRRSLRRCNEEKRRSIKKLKTLNSSDIRVRLLEHPLLPAAAIIARDVEDAKRGVIEATHYIWGWKLGSCPTVTWRAHPANQVYELYREHLKLLESEATILYDSHPTS
jgi:hypothetical protein